MIFWQKLEREGVIKHVVKNRSTLFCMIYYSIWPNQGTLCLSVCTPDPQKVIRIIENVNSKPKMSWFLSKILGEGGRSTRSTNSSCTCMNIRQNLFKFTSWGTGVTKSLHCVNSTFIFGLVSKNKCIRYLYLIRYLGGTNIFDISILSGC